jgi:hypothetical protein
MDQSTDFGTYLLYALAIIIGIVVYRYIARWIFSIDRMSDRLQANNSLLAEIAKKQGVDEKIVNGIIDKAES